MQYNKEKMKCFETIDIMVDKGYEPEEILEAVQRLFGFGKRIVDERLAVLDKLGIKKNNKKDNKKRVLEGEQDARQVPVQQSNASQGDDEAEKYD